jgi:hypothetical protein
MASAIDFIKDRRNPRKKLLDAPWKVESNVLRIEENGALKELGLLDWNRTRFLEEEFWAWTGATYYVLSSDKEIGRAPPKTIKWGPTKLPEGYVDPDEE